MIDCVVAMTLFQFVRSSWITPLLALLFHSILIVHTLTYKDIHDFIFIGSAFINQGKVSPLINQQLKYAFKYNGSGYDGQFYYYMAIDPIGARYYTDYAGYRYARVLYPLLARIAALGNTTMIPYTLLLINLFSIAVGTFLVCARVWIISGSHYCSTT